MLDSVVDSIESPRNRGPAAASEPVAAGSSDAEHPSPSGRHRALADALFGVEDRIQASTPVQAPLAPSVLTASKSQEQLTAASQTNAPTGQSGLAMKRSQSMRSTPKISGKVLVDNSELALDVQRRAEAATAALKKSPSNPRMAEASSPGLPRRISPHQISSPTLVSASTSVDTIPLPPVSAHLGQVQGSSLKIRSPFKRLRGTLRAKAAPTGDEVTPFPLTLGTPQSVRSETFPNAIPTPRVEPALLSAPNAAQFKVPPAPLPSPPNTAAPGLKGFMARFRKQRGQDVYLSPQRRTAPSSATSATSSSAGPSPPFDRNFGQQVTSAPPSKMEFRSASSAVTRVPPPQSPTPRPNTTESVKSQAASLADQSALVKQLYDAASNLGIDQAALNDLLSRSPSASSRTTDWTSLSRMASVANNEKGGAVASDKRPSMDTTSPRPSTDSRQIPTIRHPVEPLQRSREQRPDQSHNAIVRRTIIFPSDSRASGIDLNSLVRKQSAARRRRSASAASVQSTRSIQDRVPTPPPPHRTGKRFSTDTSPPVPQLPASFSTQIDGMLVPPPAQIEQSSSTYESL